MSANVGYRPVARTPELRTVDADCIPWLSRRYDATRSSHVGAPSWNVAAGTISCGAAAVDRYRGPGSVPTLEVEPISVPAGAVRCVVCRRAVGVVAARDIQRLGVEAELARELSTPKPMLRVGVLVLAPRVMEEREEQHRLVICVGCLSEELEARVCDRAPVPLAVVVGVAKLRTGDDLAVERFELDDVQAVLTHVIHKR